MKTNTFQLSSFILGFIFFGLISLTQSEAQAPELFNYQAIALDASGGVYANQSMDVEFNITQGQNGAILYAESHTVMTNDKGIFSVLIGNGQVLSGNISNIDWANDNPWIETQADFGTGSFQSLGTSRLVSVPFAQHAQTAADVDDADADPMNEIQQLSLNNTTLSLSQGNQVDLSAVSSPWTRDAAGIKFDQGLARVIDINTMNEIAMDGRAIYGGGQGFNYELLPESITFSRTANDWSSNMDAVAVDLNNPNGPERTYITRDSISISEAACSTTVKPGLIRMEDTLGIRRTHYSKDSLYFLNAPTTLAIPDETTIAGTGIHVQTRLVNQDSKLSSAHLEINNGQSHSQLTGSSLRMYNTFQPSPRDLVQLEPDTLAMTNSSGWLNARMTTDSKDGGRLNLFGSSGSEVAFLGTNPDTFLSGPYGGTLLLKDAHEKTRILASTYQNEGYLDVSSPTRSASLYPGSASVSVLDSVAPDASIITTSGNLYHNGDRTSGQLDLFYTSNHDAHIIARLGGDDFNTNAGRFCLFNENKDFEKVCILADNEHGGEINLFSDESHTFFAGSEGGRGRTYVADTVGLAKSIMQVDELGHGQFISEKGGLTIIDQYGSDLAKLDEYGLFLTDSAGASSAYLGKYILWPNVGVQYMYGRNHSSNVYIGFDENEGEILPSGNYGVVEALDHNSQRRSWLSGTGEMGSQTLRVVDSSEASKIVASVDAGSAGVMEFIGQNGSTNITLGGGIGNLGNIQVHDHNSTVKAGIGVDLFSGDGVVFGDIKNFRMQHPSDSNKEIWYASLEGPEAGAYHRGTAQLKNGESFIPFPDHIIEVCNLETMTVQLTPRHWDTYGLALVEIREDGFMVKELKGGTGNFAFDWEVKAVRKGFENYQPVMTKQEVAQKFSFQKTNK